MQYFDDNSIRGGVYTQGSWKVVETDVFSGSWTHYALTYDNNEVKLYMNGSLVDTLGANGYLNWGDGDDYNLYLGARGVTVGEPKQRLMK